MDRRERFNEISEALLAILGGHQAEMWTALPGIVQSFNADEMTLVVQPSIRARVQKSDYSFEWVALPLLLDVPVVFPGAGGFTITFPIATGDEVLVIFASRCIDAWWQMSGIQVQPDLRMHDLSDGFAIPGPKSKPNALSSISATNLQIRANDGTSYIEITPGGIINILAPGGVNITGDLNVDGEIVATGNVETADGITLHDHIHTGGGPPPVPGH